MLLRVTAIACSMAVAWTFAASRVEDPTRLPLGAIVNNAVVTQPFGCTALSLEPFDPLCPTRHVHTGVDLAAPAGTTVRSATGGVAHVGYDSRGAGLYVAVELMGPVRLLYCHLFSVAVYTGQQIAPGETIGSVGASGLATGPHVHFEVQVNGRSVDPARWLESGS